MNKLGKFAVSLAISYLMLKVATTKPIRNYVLRTILNTAYYMLKRKLT